MGRKNLLNLSLEEAQILAPISAGTTEDKRTQGTPVVNSLRDSMRDLGLNGVQELDPTMVESAGPQDRLSVEDSKLSDLAESIRTYGQQVPILVRPVSGSLNRYSIVYGRRRLAAIRSLGPDIKVKALVRTLDDETSIIAQGQENNQRLDPSHIEKALFARELRRMGYDNRVVQDALGIDRFAAAKLVRLAEIIPESLIRQIGAAHEIGRRPWTEMADLLSLEGLSLAEAAFLALKASPSSLTGADRFRVSLAAMKQRVADKAAAVAHGPQKRLLGNEGPAPQMEFSASRKEITLSLAIKKNPDFANWFEKNADALVKELQDRWIQENKSRA